MIFIRQIHTVDRFREKDSSVLFGKLQNLKKLCFFLSERTRTLESSVDSQDFLFGL